MQFQTPHATNTKKKIEQIKVKISQKMKNKLTEV